jgi:ABC-type multidrug transport system fused ATPase/permease subunit
VGQRVRNELVGRLLSLSRGFFDRSKSGDLMALQTNDIIAVRMMLGPGILVGVDTLMLVSLVIVVMFALSWKLALLALIMLEWSACSLATWVFRVSTSACNGFRSTQPAANTTQRAAAPTLTNFIMISYP